MKKLIFITILLSIFLISCFPVATYYYKVYYNDGTTEIIHEDSQLRLIDGCVCYGLYPTITHSCNVTKLKFLRKEN